jgi:hypothetical protein
LVLSFTDPLAPESLQIQNLNNTNGVWQATFSEQAALDGLDANSVSLLHVNGGDASSLLLSGVNAATYDIEFSRADSITTSQDWTAPKQLLERQVQSDGSVLFSPIQASAAPTASLIGADPVIAVNNNGTINIYSLSESRSSLVLSSSFTGSDTDPAINPNSAPGLTTTDTGLALTYTNADQSINLQRLDFFSLAGDAQNGVVFTADGFNVANADLQWQTTTLNTGNGGLSSSLATAPVVVNGNLLLSSIDPNNDNVLLSVLPVLSNPESTTWMNSTIQLPDENGAWLISQTDPNTVSTLTAVGDLDGDGLDDLIVVNNSVSTAVVDAPDVWNVLGNGASSVASPALAQLGDTLYMAVQSNSGSNNIYWSSSTDNGDSWADFQPLPLSMTEVGAFYWTDLAPDIVNSGREEQCSVSM